MSTVIRLAKPCLADGARSLVSLNLLGQSLNKFRSRALVHDSPPNEPALLLDQSAARPRKYYLAARSALGDDPGCLGGLGSQKRLSIWCLLGPAEEAHGQSTRGLGLVLRFWPEVNPGHALRILYGITPSGSEGSQAGLESAGVTLPVKIMPHALDRRARSESMVT